MCTKEKALQILEDVYTLSRKFYGSALQSGYLYGSYARGDYTDESDVDILITVNCTQGEISVNRRNIADISSEMSLKYDVTVSVTVKPAKQFTDYSEILPFYRNVVNEGIRYGA